MRRCPAHYAARRRTPAAGWALAAVVLLSVFVTSQVKSAVVERVVAVVDEHAILLSDLRARARPFVVRIQRELPPGAQRAAATSQTYKLLLEKMIDELLEQRAAAKAKITVTAQDVDQALQRVAAQNGLTIPQLLAEARRTGMNEADYRREIRRQLLDAKMMNLRLQGKVRITPQDVRDLYERLQRDERKRLRFRAAWIVLDTTEDAPSNGASQQRQLASTIVEQARRGADFADLARRYSEDDATRERGGLLPAARSGRLPAPVVQVLLGLEVGDVAAPIRVAGQLVIIKLIEREESSLPSFEEAQQELQQRVYMEKMSEARQHWLEGLRRRTHVEVRL